MTPSTAARPEPVARVALHRVRLPLVTPHVAAHGTEHEREVVLVAVTTDRGAVGWGECSALSRPTYTAEHTDGTWALLRDELAPALLAGRPSGVVGHPLAHSAVATAVLDARLRTDGVRLADHLGATRSSVPVAAVVGLSSGTGELVERVGAVLDRGAALVALKVQPGSDVEPLRAVRDHWPGLALAADANGSYRRGDTEHLARLDDIGLAYLEQPLPAEDLVGSAALARRLDTPVALDESVTSVGGWEAALALGAADALNLKPARVGGPAEARRVHDLAVDAGAEVWVGGLLETGVGRALALAVAGLPGCTRPTHLGPSARYFADDVTEPLTLGPGATLTVPTGPGMGVAPRPDRLAAVTVEHCVLER